MLTVYIMVYFECLVPFPYAIWSSIICYLILVIVPHFFHPSFNVLTVSTLYMIPFAKVVLSHCFYVYFDVQ